MFSQSSICPSTVSKKINSQIALSIIETPNKTFFEVSAQTFQDSVFIFFIQVGRQGGNSPPVFTYNSKVVSLRFRRVFFTLF